MAVASLTSGIMESHSVAVVYRVCIHTGRPSCQGEVGDFRVGDIRMVVTMETNSSSSPRDCILTSLLIIRDPTSVCVCVCCVCVLCVCVLCVCVLCEYVLCVTVIRVTSAQLIRYKMNMQPPTYYTMKLK